MQDIVIVLTLNLILLITLAVIGLILIAVPSPDNSIYASIFIAAVIYVFYAFVITFKTQSTLNKLP